MQIHMKTLNEYINEKLVLTKNTKIVTIKTKKDLINEIKKKIDNNDYNFSGLYVGALEDFSNLFLGIELHNSKIDVSNWDLRNCKNMEGLFYGLKNIEINGLETWNVSNVENMENMFADCELMNIDLSNWDVSNVNNFAGMFSDCKKFKGNGLENWDVSNGDHFFGMFHNCTNLECDLSNWNIKEDAITKTMFKGCNLENHKKPKNIK